jgi:hypothetical protein
LAAACSALLLFGAAAHRMSLPSPREAEAYHAHVRDVASSTPIDFAGWSAKDVGVSTEATGLLHPNVIMYRSYQHARTGGAAGLLFVQCKDVRDLAPHYPPVCYPGQGLSLTGQSRVDLSFGHTRVTATRYVFESNSLRRSGGLTVDNFMILPDGRTQPDMTGVERRIGADQRYFGAAQVQVVHHNVASSAENSAISESILANYEPLIDAIRGGVKNAK